MYPNITIDLNKLRENVEAIGKIVKKENDYTFGVVTKGLCADDKFVDLVCNSEVVDFVADSRMQNLEKFAKKARNADKKTLLLRIPMQSEIAQVVEHVDICMISEFETIRMINGEAQKAGKVQDLLLMIDLGDLREGIFFKNTDEIYAVAEEIVNLDNINLYGVGVNLTCYGAIIPKRDNLSKLVEFAKEIEKRFGIKLEMVSGGNSSSVYLMEKDDMPTGINSLRVGEACLNGNDTAYGSKFQGTFDDAFILNAEIIELKEKPSVPIGESGLDAFGKKPVYEDRGVIYRAIVAIGKQDIDTDSIEPVDSQVDVLGGSSDHVILDVTKCDRKYKLGDIVSFKVGYGSMLKAMTSPYVEKIYK